MMLLSDAPSSGLLNPIQMKQLKIFLYFQMLNFEPHTWYNLVFQLEGTNECTDPPLALNTTFIDILKKKKKLDLQNIHFESEWPYIDGW